MDTVLVTGGAGFIGSHLCEKLLEEGNKVICVDNFITSSRQNISHLLTDHNFAFLQHDVINPLPENVKAGAVFHLASPASPNKKSPISYHKLAMETMLVNTEGTLKLLRFAKQNKAKFLFASTSEIYGDPQKHPQDEQYRGNVSTTAPRSVYDEAKRFGETLTAYFAREEKTDTRIARIFNTYGPRMSKSDMRMVINFTLQALSGEPITIYGDGEQTRSLCHVSDTVEGLYRLMFYPNTKGEVVNIGSRDEHTVLEYAKTVKSMTGSHSPIVFTDELPEDDPVKRCPDISKAMELIDWKPIISLDQGLKKMIDYLKLNLKQLH